MITLLLPTPPPMDAMTSFSMGFSSSDVDKILHQPPTPFSSATKVVSTPSHFWMTVPTVTALTGH
jgi:hypothetical protein